MSLRLATPHDAIQPLKGVIDGKPYPILYCDIKDENTEREEELLGVNRSHNPTKLREYLLQFIDGTSKLIRPFIEGDDHQRYKEIPARIIALREQLMAEEKNRGYLDAHAEPPDAEGEPKQPKPPKPRSAE